MHASSWSARKKNRKFNLLTIIWKTGLHESALKRPLGRKKQGMSDCFTENGIEKYNLKNKYRI